MIAPLECCLSSGAGSESDGSTLEPVVCGEYITEGYAWQGAVNAGEVLNPPACIDVPVAQSASFWAFYGLNFVHFDAGNGSGRGCGGRRRLRGA